MIKTDLLEFEETNVKTNPLSRTIALLVAFITCGLWVNPIINLFNNGFRQAGGPILFYLQGFTFFIGLFTFLFMKQSKAGWFLLVLFLALFSGAAIAVLSLARFSESDIFHWRRILSILVNCCLLIAIVLLFHNKTAKKLSLNNWVYGFGMISAALMLVGGFYLVRLGQGVTQG
jgi:hypothetical protein